MDNKQIKINDSGTIEYSDGAKIEILEKEIKYFETLIEPHDCGFIYTTISFLKDRIENLKGNKNEWPFSK